MPLGSLSTRGLAGPYGTPLIGELPAPADPASGASCPYALAGATMLPSIRATTRAEQRYIESFRACLVEPVRAVRGPGALGEKAEIEGAAHARINIGCPRRFCESSAKSVTMAAATVWF
jgi:hypothetical protein